MTQVLVIEDEELIRESILYLLNARGFNATGATDGYAGVELALEIVPDLILCDVRMPGLDGYDVLRTLRNNSITATVPFVFLTAQISLAYQDLGQALAADGYLTKPFTADQLLEVITTVLEDV